MMTLKLHEEQTMNTINKFALAAMLALGGVTFCVAALAEIETPVPQTSMSEGEIRKVDKDGAKLTIKHGALVNLAMPAMTMVFRVRDPAMLEQVAIGDQVRFVAGKVGGALTVMTLETVK